MLFLFFVAKKLIVVDFFNSYFLDGSCLFLGGLRGFRRFILLGISIIDRILLSIFRVIRDLEEFYLIGTRISELCILEIIVLRKLKYIGFFFEGVCGFGRSGVLLIVKVSSLLRILDC